jgi:hypothetical protein
LATRVSSARPAETIWQAIKETRMHNATPTVKGTWLAWERLRILYNVILLVQGLICLSVLHPRETFIWMIIVTFAACANVLYCLGPLTEISIAAVLGRRMDGVRYFIFAVGLLFSMYVILAYTMVGYEHMTALPEY